MPRRIVCTIRGENCPIANCTTTIVIVNTNAARLTIDVAIDDRHSASSGKVKTAIAAAGAAVELSEGQTKALDRLLGGEVPAAILTLVYPETGFADIAGFRIFRVPLSPRSLKARL